LVKFHCGKEILIDCYESDPCEKINTAERYNIILVERGSLTIKIDDTICTFAAPCVLLLKEDLHIEFISSHTLSAKTISFAVSFLNINITYEMINSGQYEAQIDRYGFIPLNFFYERSMAYSYALPLPRDTFLQLDALFSEVQKALNNRSDNRWSCWTRLHLNMILELLYQTYKDYLNREFTAFDIKKPNVWVSLLLEQIHNNYQKDISLHSLSEFIHINKTTVAKQFKEITGCTVTEYINTYRIQCACHALSTTALKVCEIAAECGFASEAYFIKRFKAKMNMTPLEYRTNILNRRKAEFQCDSAKCCIE
jgi:DNA-binding helix-turn-helix protein